MPRVLFVRKLSLDPAEDLDMAAKKKPGSKTLEGSKKKTVAATTPTKRSPVKSTAPKRSTRHALAEMADLGATAVRKLTFIAVAKASSTSFALALNGQVVSLRQDGDTWSGRKKVDVDDSVAVRFRAAAADTTRWTFELSVDCPDGPTSILSKSGTLGKPGGPGFDKDVPIKPDPCA